MASRRFTLYCNHAATGAHPRLDEVLVSVPKKWTWINGGVDLPDALTLFYLLFEIDGKPVDDFQCQESATQRLGAQSAATARDTIHMRRQPSEGLYGVMMNLDKF